MKTLFILLVIAIGTSSTVLAQEKRINSNEQFKFSHMPAMKAHSSITDKASAPLTLTRTENQSHVNHELWIYDAWVSLHGDTDYDGFYHHLDLEFDADTIFAQQDVYAILYLGQGDTFESYHVTDVFTIFGESSDDTLVVESEFVNGYNPYEYELMIELYDAYSNQLVAVTDGVSDPDLAYLPIESMEFDQPSPPVVIVEEHGGSAGWWLLGLAAFARYRFNQTRKA